MPPNTQSLKKTTRYFLATAITSLMLIFMSGAVLAAPLGNGGGETTDCSTSNNPKVVQTCLKNNPFIKDINKIVQVLSAGVGLVVVAMVILGGIQYITAGDNATAIAAAKSRILNALIALVLFLFMASFLQWLIPGGIFTK
jgi:cytochrome bd-type quinol oxidase subunit 2